MATVNTARIAALPEDYFADKKFTRKDLADALHALAAELENPAFAAAVAAPVASIQTRCGAKGGRGRTCKKTPGHGGQHRYDIAPASPHRAPARPWQKVEIVRVQGSGSRWYDLRPGYITSIKGTGRGGAVGRGWTVISIERHRETGQINVEVKRDRTGHSRVFTLDKFVPVRQPKGK